MCVHHASTAGCAADVPRHLYSVVAMTPEQERGSEHGQPPSTMLTCNRHTDVSEWSGGSSVEAVTQYHSSGVSGCTEMARAGVPPSGSTSATTFTGSTLTWVFGGHGSDPGRNGVVIYNATGLPLCQTCNYLSEIQREDHTRSRWYAEVPLMGRTVLEIAPGRCQTVVSDSPSATPRSTPAGWTG